MNNSLGAIYLQSLIQRLLGYKKLADQTFAQLQDEDLFYQPNEASNSIAFIIQHMAGNMLSRWTNFLTEDGEKSWRNRDREFEPDPRFGDRRALLAFWEKGWSCMMDTLSSLKEEDLLKTILIRGEQLIVVDALNRQLAHYPHHVGQIIYAGKLIRDRDWKNLSIPRGQSEQFNKTMKAGR